jgi:predicted nucleic acid-binding protein
LGLKPAEAVGNVVAIRERTTLLEEDARVTDRLLRLIDDVECGGKQVHDANIVATMLVNGVGTVITMNVGDFERFASYVSIVRL